MSDKTPSVFKFKITLMGSKPLIWRRIVVPEQFSFWDLHGAIQDAMGWGDLHAHQFRIYGHRFGSAKEFEKVPVKSDKTVKINQYFDCIECKAVYEYDFENKWEHGVVLEDVIQEAEGCGDHPRCVAGKGACPPENRSGLNGFPNQENHRKMSEIIFDPNSVEFNHFAFGELVYRVEGSDEDDSMEDQEEQVVSQECVMRSREIRVSPRQNKEKRPARFADFCM